MGLNAEEADDDFGADAWWTDVVPEEEKEEVEAEEAEAEAEAEVTAEEAAARGVEDDTEQPCHEDTGEAEVSAAHLGALGDEEEEEWPDAGGQEGNDLAGEDEEAYADAEADDADAAEAEEEEAMAEADPDEVYATLNEELNANDGSKERSMLAKLRRELEVFLRPRKLELEAFGSYVTGLGLPSTESGGRSDLDMVLLFHGVGADVKGNEVREQVVIPTISRLGSWLEKKPGFVVKNVIKGARVPIVTFATKDMEVDISVQQPFGVLNSWHLRDLCASGRPGRLRLLVRLIKLWAKSKSIHSAKDGALSSYGYSMLAAAYLQESGALPALLGGKAQDSRGPYSDTEGALRQVLEACREKRAAGAADGTEARLRVPLWREPEEYPPGASAEADLSPSQLFQGFLRWLQEKVFGFLQHDTGAPGGCGTIPLSKRHIVSVRPRSQNELRMDVTWSAKRSDHWSPQNREVFLLIEEPFTGENVARSVRSQGFWAIHAEVERAREFFSGCGGITGDLDTELAPFNALVKLPPLTTRAQPPNGVGLGGAWRGGAFGAKRPRDWRDDGSDAGAPATKRPFGGKGADGKWGPRPPMLPPGAPQSLRLPPRRAGMGVMRPPAAVSMVARPPARPPPQYLRRGADDDDDDNDAGWDSRASKGKGKDKGKGKSKSKGKGTGPPPWARR
eukprot:TRINITY_DN22090_c0_g3_i1.p1 TRINITY_DN22090_c0_g3~~TRINITY_DN22090_c0_g3_i1.p1  ORF type:complete len:678 (-),score=183.47 TRINITY_DN22090_c0_g3_i1:213-2246(-)